MTRTVCPSENAFVLRALETLPEKRSKSAEQETTQTRNRHSKIGSVRIAPEHKPLPGTWSHNDEQRDERKS